MYTRNLKAIDEDSARLGIDVGGCVHGHELEVSPFAQWATSPRSVAGVRVGCVVINPDSVLPPRVRPSNVATSDPRYRGSPSPAPGRRFLHLQSGLPILVTWPGTAVAASSSTPTAPSIPRKAWRSAKILHAVSLPPHLRLVIPLEHGNILEVDEYVGVRPLLQWGGQHDVLGAERPTACHPSRVERRPTAG